MREFNLEEAKAGKPVVTRDGRNARIICYDRKEIDNQPILALVEDREIECVRCYDQYGNFLISGKPHALDLYMKTEKHEGWGWLNKCAHVYNTEEEALAHKPDYGVEVSLVKVVWEEQQ